MDVKRFRAQQAALRERDLIAHAAALRGVPGAKTAKAAFELDNYLLKAVTASIRSSHPDISKKELLAEIKKVYGLSK
ncbi:MAG: hypothetical protein QME65_05955 [Candidatus Omnitrophota bacterium]|nr:hypothetical protein [Candidatus Omnitrophota bacterium]